MSVRVPVDEFPPVTAEGLSVTLPTVPCVEGGERVRMPLIVLAEVAKTVTGVEPATADVVTEKVAVV